jgi:hypothetical protein
MITATVNYLKNGQFDQRTMTAETEEQLLNDVFMFYAEAYPRATITIGNVQYNGETLRWNDFIAHNHFAKGRLTFEEFKKLCSTANMSVARCN